jgi:hypothetical protein
MLARFFGKGQRTIITCKANAVYGQDNHNNVNEVLHKKPSFIQKDITYSVGVRKQFALQTDEENKVGPVKDLNKKAREFGDPLQYGISYKMALEA